MQRFRLSDMKGGWFVGDFTPTAHVDQNCEVAVKTYKPGDFEPTHHHKVAREVTLILSGKAEMCGQTLSDGDIAVLEPGEATSFKALTAVTTVVVKTPSVKNDKYEGTS